jgi:serine/threonine-protein kinase TTK/MPS1
MGNYQIKPLNFLETCPICFIDNIETISVIHTDGSSGHKFCKECIYEWFSKNKTCPLCRQNILYINSKNNTFLFKKIIKKILSIQGKFLYYIPNKYKSDKDLVITAVTNNGLSLKYAHPILKKDKYIVLKAVQQNGLSLQYADISLLSDDNIVLQAVKNDGNALRFADSKFRKNKDIIIESLKSHPLSIIYIDDSLLNSSFKYEIMFIITKSRTQT